MNTKIFALILLTVPASAWCMNEEQAQARTALLLKSKLQFLMANPPAITVLDTGTPCEDPAINALVHEFACFESNNSMTINAFMQRLMHVNLPLRAHPAILTGSLGIDAAEKKAN